MSNVEHVAGSHLANVCLALKRLREAALAQIPDLDEVTPDLSGDAKKWTKQMYRLWAEAALRRSTEAIEWRDRVLALLGSTQVKNECKPDPDWPHQRLCKELGYYLSRRVKDEHRNDVRDDAGKLKYEPDPDWGPPETLLGEFYQDEELEADRKRRGDDRQQFIDYVPGSHPFLYLGDARTYLGDVPKDLSQPMPFALLTGRIVRWSEDEGLPPWNWLEYASILLQQCLLVRARALEVCAWCEHRLNVVRTSLHPMIRIGPALKGMRNRRPVRVEVAGQPLKLPSDMIAHTHASLLLKLKGGKEVTFNRKYSSELIAMIPPLSGLLRSKGSAFTERQNRAKRLRNEATYTLDQGVVVVEVELSDAM